MILLLGANGSMGQRYQAILNHMAEPYHAVDLDNCDNDLPQEISSVIIATPTDTHYSMVKKYGHMGPVLCEKPITRSLAELEELLHYIRGNSIDFTMMLQYKMLDDPASEGPTVYNYYNTGKDGLNWDCLQPIALARGVSHIKNESPVWICQLNGKDLTRKDMDWAYVRFIRNWLSGSERQDHYWLMDIHYKASKWNEC